MPGTIADADAVSELIYRLQQSAVASREFGDGAGAVNVSGEIEAPWPHIAVSPSGAGDLRGMVGGSIATGVLLEFVASADLSIGPAELWQRSMRVLADVVAMTEAEQPPGRAVLCSIEPSGFPSEQELASGQYRCSITVMVVIAPPQD